MSNFVGKQFGNYRLCRLLGQGGFADVYLGEHIYLKRQAAIKVLHLRLLAKEQPDFLTEAKLIAHLKHPHIIRILEYGVEDTIPFLVMSYAPGGTLSDFCPKGTCLPLEVIVSYVNQVAKALQYAHDQRVIHRDIKPENMLIGKHGQILLSDFGIAIIAHNSSSQSIQDVIGTVSYMAPEQLQGKPRPASDQYSLAIVVYRWLTGCLPFTGVNYLEIAAKHLSVTPSPLYEHNPTLTPAIEQVVLRALAKDYHQRYESVHTFARAFEEACMPSLPLSSFPTRPLSLSASLHHVSSSLPSIRTKGRISRRTIVTSLVAGAILSGGVAGLTFSHALDHPIISPPRSRATPSGPSIGKLLYLHHNTAAVSALAWSPNSKWIACGADDGLHVWDALTGNGVMTLKDYDQFSQTLVWSPESQRIAFPTRVGVTRPKSTVTEVWSLMAKNTITYHQQYVSSSLAWSPNGRYLASADPGNGNLSLYIWDVTTSNDVFSFMRRDSETVVSVAWSPDGTSLALGVSESEKEKPVTTIQVWDITTGRQISTYYGHTGAIGLLAVVWSPDAKSIASADGQTVQIWEAKTAKHLVTYNSQHTALVWSPDNKAIASCQGVFGVSGPDGTVHIDSTVHIWSPISGSDIFVYRGHYGQVQALTWSPDGKYLASGGRDHSVQVWQAS